MRLDEVVLRTLEKEPDRRYQQASEVKLDVEAIRSKPVAAKPSTLEKPRGTWSFGRLAFLVIIVLMGTFAGLVASFVIVSWLSYSSLQQPMATTEENRAAIPTASQKAAALEHYVTEVERQRLEQQRQKQLEEAVRDPLEANAVVQFTTDGVKLHPRFGLNELNSEQRLAIEQIMNARHQEYLLYESRAAKREPTANGVQIVTISNLDTETSTLENDFWTDIDSALPVAQQKFLRLNLPLYQDQHSGRARHFLIDALPAGMSGGSSGIMSGGGMPPMSATPGGLAIDPSILRYQQLLGWNLGYLPLQIVISRRGKWFAWSLYQARVDRSSEADGTVRETYVPQLELDHGEAPELPSGLRRFWRESPSPNAVGQRPDTHAEGLDFQPAEIVDAESSEFIVWMKTGELRLSHWFAKAIRLDGDKLDQVNSLATETWKKYMALEAKHTQYSTTPEAEYVAVVSAFPIERRQLEAEFWEKLDALVEGTVNEQLHVPKFTSHHVNSVCPGLFGWAGHLDKVQVTIWKKGNWFHWRTRNKRDSDGLAWGRGEGDGASLPIMLAHYWQTHQDRLSSQVSSDTDSLPTRPLPLLDDSLRSLDALRAADQTPWDEVEQLAKELLAKFTAPADKGRIHWMAAHVYGQSDIRGHAADVIRHAQEALRYERDPVQRGWLFMYLGDASGLIARRDEATRWYLKGYLELLPFNLPDKAPELPPVGKFGGDLRDSSDGEVDPELIAIEVKRAAEMKARQDAEFTRELVSRRDIYIRQLADLDARGNPLDGKDVKPESQLRAIASEVLRDQTAIEQLLKRVALSKPILGEKPPD